jgi:hypothetical protein
MVGGQAYLVRTVVAPARSSTERIQSAFRSVFLRVPATRRTELATAPRHARQVGECPRRGCPTPTWYQRKRHVRAFQGLVWPTHVRAADAASAGPLVLWHCVKCQEHKDMKTHVLPRCSFCRSFSSSRALSSAFNCTCASKS